jgi:3-mercaptopyruvate sulfurtransferase SseA
MNLITRDELYRKLERGDDFKLVMTLSHFAFEAKRIPTSLHFDEAVSRLDRCDEIVVYCGDVHCAASIRAYRRLERAGYRYVRRYAGGIADWEEAGSPLDRAQSVQRRKPRSSSGS